MSVLRGFDVGASVVIPHVVTGITGSRSAVRRTNATLPLNTVSLPARDKACRNIKAYLFGNFWGHFLEDDWKRNYRRLSLKWELTRQGSSGENCVVFFLTSSKLIYSPHTSLRTGFLVHNHPCVFTSEAVLVYVCVETESICGK